MTTEERDALLLRLDSTVTRLDSTVTRLDSTVTRLEAGQDELRVYMKAMARKLLAPVEIAEIETEVVNANAIAAD
jgi:uncharacterized coiled-coil protein SlyX